MPKRPKSKEVEEAKKKLKTLDVPERLRLGLIKIDKDSFLGEGGFGMVYSSFIGGTKVAVKCSSKLSGHDDDRAKALIKEFLMLQDLSHENVVTVMGVGLAQFTSDALGPSLQPCVVMEFMAGTLKEYRGMAKPGSKLRLDVFGYFLDVARGLEYMHFKSLMHRDLKPANILVKNRIAKIADVGLVKVMPDSTTTMSRAGTAPFMAPEVLQHKPYAYKADVYSVGLVMVDILLDGVPEPKNRPTIKTRLNEVEDNVQLRGLIMDTLQPNQRKRSDAADMHRRLAALLKGIKEGRHSTGDEGSLPVPAFAENQSPADATEDVTNHYGNDEDADLGTTGVVSAACNSFDEEINEYDLVLLPSYLDPRIVSQAGNAGPSRQSRKRQHSSVEL